MANFARESGGNLEAIRAALEGGGATGGDASAANQTTQIARSDSILTALASLLSELQQKLEAGDSVSVSNFPVTQPVSTAALPLPSGASTGAKQDSLLTELQLKADLTETQPVSLASVPLPTGASTEGTLLSIKSAVETIDNFISGTKGLVTEDNSAAIKTAVEKIDDFISGARGLVTEDSAAAIKAAVETIDNFISGARGLVTEDNSAAILSTLASLLTELGQKLEPGDLATLATSAKQDSGNTSLATIAAAVKAEDAASADLDTGVPLLSVRTDAPNAPPTSLTGDYQFLASDSKGRLWVNADAVSEIGNRTNELLLATARRAAEHLRLQSMMSGAFIPIPEVF